VSRRFNNNEQIEERLENARTVDSYKTFYDHVVNNDDGMLEQAESSIKQIIMSYVSRIGAIYQEALQTSSSKGED